MTNPHEAEIADYIGMNDPEHYLVCVDNDCCTQRSEDKQRCLEAVLGRGYIVARAEADLPAVGEKVESGHWCTGCRSWHVTTAQPPPVSQSVEEARRALLDHTTWHAWDCEVERVNYRIVGGICTCLVGQQVAAFERAVTEAVKNNVV